MATLELGATNDLWLPDNEHVLGKKVFPVVLGTAAYGSGRLQDPVTKFFPSRLEGIEHEVELLQAALDVGYNVIDTAEAYGLSEYVVGEAIRKYPRDSLVIATKVGIRFNPDSSLSVTDSIMESVKRSASRLGTVPDILFVHNRWDGHMGAEMDECLNALGWCVRLNLAGSIGISNFQPQELTRAIEVLGDRIKFYQAKINLVNPRKDAAETLQICKDHGITFMASAALDRGNVVASDAEGTVAEIAAKYRITVAQLGILAVRALGVLPLVQTHNVDHLLENFAALSFTIEKADMQKLTSLLLRKPQKV